MWKKIILIINIIIFYSIGCILIHQKYNPEITHNIITEFKEKISTPPTKEIPIGKLIIKKININENLYSIDSPQNNIEQHVTILSPSKEPTTKNSTIFIAAHSGAGKIAYFKNLDKLTQNDQITLIYKNITYTYIVKNIWEDKKTGSITVPKENTNQLILTTCSPTKENYQLIINCIAK